MRQDIKCMTHAADTGSQCVSAWPAVSSPVSSYWTRGASHLILYLIVVNRYIVLCIQKILLLQFIYANVMNIQVLLIRFGLEKWSILVTSTWHGCYDMRDVKYVAVFFKCNVMFTHHLLKTFTHKLWLNDVEQNPYLLFWKILQDLSSYDE